MNTRPPKVSRPLNRPPSAGRAANGRAVFVSRLILPPVLRAERPETVDARRRQSSRISTAPRAHATRRVYSWGTGGRSKPKTRKSWEKERTTSPSRWEEERRRRSKKPRISSEEVAWAVRSAVIAARTNSSARPLGEGGSQLGAEVAAPRVRVGVVHVQVDVLERARPQPLEVLQLPLQVAREVEAAEKGQGSVFSSVQTNQPWHSRRQLPSFSRAPTTQR